MIKHTIPMPFQTFLKTVRLAVPVILSVACILWLANQVPDLNFKAIQRSLGQISPTQWMIAIAATTVSYWALGSYDAIWHRTLDTKVEPQTARVTGMAAIALGQTLGFGAFTAGLVRWAALHSLTGLQTAKLSAGVTMSFMAAWMSLAVPSYFFLGLSIPFGLLSTAILAAILVLAFAWRSVSSLVTLLLNAGVFRLAGYAFIDVSTAALALYVLLPEAVGLSFGLVLAAFILALGAGIVSNSPSGVGVFDATFCALIFITPDASILAALVGFRIIYYIIPACIAVAWVALNYQSRNPSAPIEFDATPPNWDLLRQGARTMRTREGIWMVRQSIGATIAIGGPIMSGRLKMSPDIFRKRIRPKPCAVYKCDGRTASSARLLGWTAIRIASDAVITPIHWDASTPEFRQLRRKLSQAKRSGITVTTGQQGTTDQAMEIVAREWKTTSGGEMGFSMGRWKPEYVGAQKLYLIWEHTNLVGFVTFQTRKDAWALDLIRYTPDTPSGAVHLAIHQAIQDARDAKVAKLSLGAVPSGDHLFAPFLARNRAGLSQFKAAFKPQWVPEYHAAPTRFEAVLTGVIVLLAVNNPMLRLMMIMKNRVVLLRHAQRFNGLPDFLNRGIAKR